jgi:itaconate CoA-transferase
VGDISGYGEGDPHTKKKAYDQLIQSASAILSITGTPEEQVKATISIADIAVGMYAYKYPRRVD